MINGRRFALALLFSPLAIIPAYVIGGVSVQFFFASTNESVSSTIELAFIMSIMMLVIAYPITIVFGGAAVIVLEKIRLLNFFSINLAGWIGAFFMSLMFDTWLVPFLICCFLSSVITITFWSILKYRSA